MGVEMGRSDPGRGQVWSEETPVPQRFTLRVGWSWGRWNGVEGGQGGARTGGGKVEDGQTHGWTGFGRAVETGSQLLSSAPSAPIWATQL